jgi:hypothetical protein
MTYLERLAALEVRRDKLRKYDGCLPIEQREAFIQLGADLLTLAYDCGIEIDGVELRGNHAQPKE